jgi:ABC-type uncharacterized transport system auxiliary subunit
MKSKINTQIMHRTVFCALTIFMSLAACKKSQVETVTPTTLGTDGKAISKLSVSALVDVNTNADAAFNSYNTSFLVSSGNTQYYKEALNVATKDYFWRQALDIQMVEDVYLRTKSTAHKTLITNLLNTFLQQNQGTGGLTDWN